MFPALHPHPVPAEINVLPPVQRVLCMPALTQCCVYRFRRAFILWIYLAHAIPDQRFLFQPVLLVITVRCCLSYALTVFCPFPQCQNKSYQVLYCVPLVHTSCDRKHKSGKAAPGTFSPAQSEGIPEYCSELLEVRGRMLADRADEVCGKLLMRIDIAADYADPADLLLAFFLLLLGLRLDVLKIVAVAY